jgi:hypothetical protein
MARGIEQDKAAISAGLTLPYSSGVVEGHVNRLKLIKRMMYGRARFPLLRQRVLHVCCRKHALSRRSTLSSHSAEARWETLSCRFSGKTAQTPISLRAAEMLSSVC